jgi:excisionase family DNA binding protein
MVSDGNRVEPQLLTGRELAERARVSERTVERWRHDGVGPQPIRLGHRTVRYRRSDVERFTGD